MNRRDGHHYTHLLRDPRTNVWATPHHDDHKTYAVLSFGKVYRDGHRSSDLSVHVESLEHARQLAVAAVEILDHLRRADGEPITSRVEVAS